MLREKYGFTDYRGENVEYHPSGCVTFPCLGTKAQQEDKLSFDPNRSKRRAIYQDVPPDRKGSAVNRRSIGCAGIFRLIKR
jgi:hypothetical protein